MRLAAEDVAFQIAPRLNAAGRLGQPQLAVELLVTDRPERAQELAQYIDGLNGTRQTMSAASNSRPPSRRRTSLIRRRRRAGAGRSRLAPGSDRHCGRPAGRTVPPAGGDGFLGHVGPAAGDRVRPQRAGLQLHAALADCGEFLVADGGHAAAAGLKIEPHQIEGFALPSATWPPARFRSSSAWRSC